MAALRAHKSAICAEKVSSVIIIFAFRKSVQSRHRSCKGKNKVKKFKKELSERFCGLGVSGKETKELG